MHKRASNSELVEPLPELERTLNQRLRCQKQKSSIRTKKQSTSTPENCLSPPILNINYFCHFLDILQNYDPMDDEPTWATDCVVALTL
ncbi:hypothetical protein Tco_0483182, partial [Tanacetum coccineum]